MSRPDVDDAQRSAEDRESGYWRVAIVEDHLMQRKRTEDLVAAQADLRVVGSYETLPEFQLWFESALPAQRPHLLILDLAVERQPSVDPVVVRSLVDSGLRVLVLSALASPSLVRDVLRAGVGGVVGKRDSEEDIVAAVWAVLQRGGWMTPELAAVIAGDAARPSLSIQEERALVLYASGMTLEAVASAIGVKPSTAKQYLNRVKAKYASAGRPANTKVDLATLAWQDGYIDPSRSRTHD